MSLMDASCRRKLATTKAGFLSLEAGFFKPRSRLASGNIWGTAGISYCCSSLSMGMDCTAVNYCIGSGPCSHPMPPHSHGLGMEDVEHQSWLYATWESPV